MNHEMVLYYTPEQSPKVAKMKGVLVRMGVRIKNIAPEQVTQQIGYLVGMDGYEAQEAAGGNAGGSGNESGGTGLPVIGEEVLVMHRFSSGRIDELLKNLRKAGVPRIALKAIVTESNCAWTFYQLYEELKEEHEKMSAQ